MGLVSAVYKRQAARETRAKTSAEYKTAARRCRCPIGVESLILQVGEKRGQTGAGRRASMLRASLKYLLRAELKLIGISVPRSLNRTGIRSGRER